MSKRLRVQFLAALLAGLAFAAGYALRRPTPRAGDMLDAVAAIQRHSPMHLLSERAAPRPCWLREGGVYMSRAPLTHEQAEDLPHGPGAGEVRWRGVVYFKGCADRDRHFPLVYVWQERCLDYGDFAVYGDRDLLGEVRLVLAREGFQTIREPR
jgi:hypothetical protein